MVFKGQFLERPTLIPVGELVSHVLPLDEIMRGIHLALHPDGKSLKIMVQPQRSNQ